MRPFAEHGSQKMIYDVRMGPQGIGYGGRIYNNPKWVEDADGGIIEDCLLFYGWQGPGGIHEDPSEDANRGRAYLWHNGQWV